MKSSYYFKTSEVINFCSENVEPLFILIKRKELIKGKVTLKILLCERTTLMTTMLRRQMSVQKGTILIMTSHYWPLSYSEP